MHVLLYSDFQAGAIGGGESVLVGLVRGLAALAADGDRYTVVTTPSMIPQLAPFTSARIQLQVRASDPRSAGGRLRRILRAARGYAGMATRTVRGRKPMGLPERPPALPAEVAAIDCDVLHFLMPTTFATGHPRAVCTVHDYQHEHLPAFFAQRYVDYRRMINDAVRDSCAAVVAISRFTATDFRAFHPGGTARLFVIPLGSYIPAEEDVDLTAADRLLLEGLPQDFILYPAYSYAHKNHFMLLAALATIEREHGLVLPLVCTGGRSPEWQEVLRGWDGLRPRPGLHDLGYVSRPLLRALYQKANFVVLPTLFEGAGMPLIESAHLGKPVACSDIPPFREIAGAAPLYFDPSSVGSIAAAIRTMYQDQGLRERVAAGMAAVRTGDWAAFAQAHRSVYRWVAGAPLTPAEQSTCDSLLWSAVGTPPGDAP